MTRQVAPAGRLSADQVKAVLRTAILAPSTHNTQPWLFGSGPEGIRLYADADRALPTADADRREMLLSCGAALFNLRTAIHTLGVYPATTLFPRRDEPDLLALVRPMAATRIDHRVAALARAIPRRHTNRTPFHATAVPPSAVGRLRHAAEIEHTWLPRLDAAQLAALLELVHESHQAQLNEPAFLAEWRRWTGRGPGSRDGVPRLAGGTAPEPGDEWVLRVSGSGTGSGNPVSPAAPLVVVIGSFGDGPIDRLRAGQAMQRVLLTATAEGLDASFISQPVEVPQARGRLRDLLGGGLWPQIGLRLGHGSPVSRTPRRSLADVMVDSGRLTA